MSPEELALRALDHLPRARVMDGISAFNEMKYVRLDVLHLPVLTRTLFRSRDDLLSYLRPFAQQDKVVAEEDVRRFFDERNERMKEVRWLGR